MIRDVIRARRASPPWYGARPFVGFTLIEVTLAIVIGIVLIAGATLLYNQAKLGAGNTRAKAKVAAMQGLIEELAANTGGSYPLSSIVLSAWTQRRADDYSQSPWGGPAGTCTCGGCLGAAGFCGVDNNGAGVYLGGTGAGVGMAQYNRFVGNATSSCLDRASGNQVVFINYAVSCSAADGSYFWFVKAASRPGSPTERAGQAASTCIP